jgi:hypothetical protein
MAGEGTSYGSFCLGTPVGVCCVHDFLHLSIDDRVTSEPFRSSTPLCLLDHFTGVRLNIQCAPRPGPIQQ